MNDALKVILGIVIGAFIVVVFLGCICLVLGLTWIPIAQRVVEEGYGFDPYESYSYGQPYSGMPSLTPQPAGGMVEYNEMRVAVIGYDFSGSYESTYDYTEDPPNGSKFLWVEVSVENTGGEPVYAPAIEDFAVIVDGIQIDAGYGGGHPQFVEYWGGYLYPEATKKGWIRFSVDNAIEAKDVLVVFMPVDYFPDAYYSWSLVQ
ncbi:MAG: DUF4352 domain-containing protein [Anaerolineales bacterium]|nr:DUF4352 domain-containing protein [Anaerolineales bacterium]